LVSLLICQVLGDTECIIIKGVERFSSHGGYASSFRFRGNYNSSINAPSYDQNGRLETTLIAVDALYFGNHDDEYRSLYKQTSFTNIDRELKKLYLGFSPGPLQSGHCIATGNWGCGAFGGHVQLKSLLQIIAFAVSSSKDTVNSLRYYTFGLQELIQLQHLFDVLCSHNYSIKDLLRGVSEYRETVLRRCLTRPGAESQVSLEMSLFQFIIDGIRRRI
jgi:poly(ADP-ribose) glycohydrolase